MKTDATQPRPQQDTPEDLVHRLLTTIRGQFCADLTISEWSKHQHFIRRNVILWPAWFCCRKHGFTLPAARYETIMRGIFQTIIREGKTEAVKFWPGYLMKCVQEHWNHHWEEYYGEAKAIRGLAEQALYNCTIRAPVEDKTLEALAMAHNVLTRAHKSKRPKKAAVVWKQPSLFAL